MAGESSPYANNTNNTSDYSSVSLDYDRMNSTSKHDSNKKVPVYNGDATRFEWRKDSIYHYINGIDDQL